MSKLIKITILTVTIFGLSAAVAKLRRIPAPRIDSKPTLTAADSQITIKGKGFIKDFSKAHKIILKKKGSKKKIRIQTISSTQEELELLIPNNIKYGDYDLYLFLKTKFFKSKKQRIKSFIKVRPKAPGKPKLKFYVVKNKDELVDIIDQEQEHELILNLKEELKTGINSITSFYYEDGYKSLESAPIDVYFLEETSFQSKLEISSQKPLQSFAQDIQEQRLDVTEVTHQKLTGLRKTYHLMTPSDDKYLATHIELSPIYIKEAHVKSPEYIVIKNRDTKSFSLSECHIDDEVTTRYSFEEFEVIAAQSELKVEGKLSLNDTGDTISIICSDQTIDSLEYSKADAEGFASN